MRAPRSKQSLYKPVLPLLAGLLWLLAGPLKAHSPHDHIEAFAVSPEFDRDRTILIVMRNHLFRTTDGGKNWSRIFRGLDNRFQFTTMAMGADGMAWLATKGDGVFRSSDKGLSWERINDGFGTSNIRLLHYAGPYVFASSKAKGVYRTTAGEGTWKHVLVREVDDRVTALASSSDGKTVVAGDAMGGVTVSGDGGETWGERVPIADAGAIFSALVTVEDGLVLGTERRGILTLSPTGKVGEYGVPEGGAVTALAEFTSKGSKQPRLLATTWDGGVFLEPESGDRWENRSKGTSKHEQADERDLPHFTDLAPIDGTEGTIILGAYDGLFRTDDLGKTWHEIETLPLSMILDFDVASAGGGKVALLAGTYWRGPVLSTDGGDTWKAVGLGLAQQWKVAPGDKMLRVQSVALSPNFADDGTIFAGGRNDMMISNDRGESWTRHDYGKTLGKEDMIVDRMVFSPNFASDGVMFLAARAGHDETRRPAVFRSDDGGKSVKLSHGGEGEYAHSIVISPAFDKDGTVIWASGADRGGKVYRTEDGGETWAESGGGLVMDVQGAELAISPDFAADGTVFAGTSDGFFRSKDRGKSWQLLTPGILPEGVWVEAVDISPNFKDDRTLVVSVRGFGHYLSEDGADSFRPIAESLVDQNHLLTKAWYYSPGKVFRFSPHWGEDRRLFGTTGMEVMRSDDGGKNWKMLGARKTADELEGIQTRKLIPWIGGGVGVLVILAAAFFLRKKKAARD